MSVLLGQDQLDSAGNTVELNTSINQLTYEVRFGNLSKNSYKTNKPMDTNHAISIALKLERERKLHRIHIPELYEKLQNTSNLEKPFSIARRS